MANTKILKFRTSRPQEKASTTMSSVEADRYNELVNEYNKLVDELELEKCFLQGVLETSPYEKNEEIQRGVNIAIYLSEGKEKYRAAYAVDRIVEALGLTPDLDQEKDGSFFKRVAAATKAFVKQDQVQEDLQKLKRHIENQTVNKSQAEVDNKLASSVAELLKATENEESIMLFGSFVVVRIFGADGKLKNLIKTLTTKEQIVIANDQAILTYPSSFLEQLEEKVRQLPSIENTDNLEKLTRP